MTIAIGDVVRVRVPNWKRVAGEWLETPTEHDVTVTGVGEGTFDFTPWWIDGREASLSQSQIVAIVEVSA